MSIMEMWQFLVNGGDFDEVQEELYRKAQEERMGQSIKVSSDLEEEGEEGEEEEEGEEGEEEEEEAEEESEEEEAKTGAEVLRALQSKFGDSEGT